jgi:TolB-like protein
MTAPETISRIGHQLGAKYIMDGNITNLGNQRLLVISIIQIENLQMVAGEWLKYTVIEEIQDKLPEMVRNIIEVYKIDSSRHQKLAVLPFQTSHGDQIADTLAQIFSVEIVRGGTYAVFPRTKTLEQVQIEYRNQLSGDTSDEYAIKIGKGENPLLAVSVAVRSLGTNRQMFNASIINVESGVQVKGNTVNYNAIEDGVETIWNLAGKLSGRELLVRNSEEFWNSIEFINRSKTGNFTIILNCNINTSSRQKNIEFSANGRKLVTLRGEDTERVITNGKDDALILMHPDNTLTLVLGSNLQLNGNQKKQPIIEIGEIGGSLIMETGATVRNASSYAVGVGGGSSFTMNGGTISSNYTGVLNGGSFTMNGGSINWNRNQGSYGGGGVSNSGMFILNGGKIEGNSAKEYGGGVFNTGTFVMNNGNIERNSAGKYGGGVLQIIDEGYFVKRGGSIQENSVLAYFDGKEISVGQYYFLDSGEVNIISLNYRNTASSPTNSLDTRLSCYDGKEKGWIPIKYFGWENRDGWENYFGYKWEDILETR